MCGGGAKYPHRLQTAMQISDDILQIHGYGDEDGPLVIVLYHVYVHRCHVCKRAMFMYTGVSATTPGLSSAAPV